MLNAKVENPLFRNRWFPIDDVNVFFFPNLSYSLARDIRLKS